LRNEIRAGGNFLALICLALPVKKPSLPCFNAISIFGG
jgi:hypothetical protein